MTDFTQLGAGGFPVALGTTSVSASFNLIAVSTTGAIEAFNPTDQPVLTAAAAAGAVEAFKLSVAKSLAAVATNGAVEAFSVQADASKAARRRKCNRCRRGFSSISVDRRNTRCRDIGGRGLQR